MKPGKVPKHIGIIMDGNRRFSKRLMMKPWKGHEWGAKKVKRLLEWGHELGIKELTLYSFSVENFNRPREEFKYLMDLFRKEFDNIKHDTRIREYGIRINFIGRTWMFPEDIQERMKSLMELTRGHDGHILNLAMAYGGRQEIIDAVKKIARELEDGKLDIDSLNEESFSRHLYMTDEPDLIIRTGGEHRTSNFLLWQSNYSELFFIDKMWPEFEKEDFVRVIRDYQRRDRRFGR
jgi:tritrans,polycis-undecaprenyl-diphosphate synthase [geranylgeranyl-diphosphate specific]